MKFTDVDTGVVWFGDPQGVRAEMVRNALDWFTVLWRLWVDAEVFCYLRKLAEEGRGLVLEGLANDGAPLLGRTFGRDVCFEGHGLRLLVKDPSHQPHQQKTSRQPYGVDFQIQGTAFSSQLGGGERLVKDLVDRVEKLLWPMWGEDDDDRRHRLDPFTRVGRFDVAIDVKFIDADKGANEDAGDQWIEDAIYGCGDHDRCVRGFVTRARKARTERDGKLLGQSDKGRRRRGDETTETSDERSSMRGKRTAGRTVYLGTGSSLVLCAYERDKLRTGDWPILKETLEALHWRDGQRLVRCEFRTSRAWLRDQVVTLPQGVKRRADVLTLGETLSVFSSLVGAVANRYRHTDPNDLQRRSKDREPSIWQEAIQHGITEWADRGGAFVRVVSLRREAALERAVERMAKAGVDTLALRGLPLSAVMKLPAILLERLNDPKRAEEWVKRHTRGEERFRTEVKPRALEAVA